MLKRCKQHQNRPINRDNTCSKYVTLKQTARRPRSMTKQEAQLMLTTGSTRLAVSRGQQTWYHSTCYI